MTGSKPSPCSLAHILKTPPRADCLLYTSVEITETSHWEDKVSKNGLSYRTGSVKALVHKDGFVIPVCAKGISTRSGTSTIYTVFVADQASGKYLDTCLLYTSEVIGLFGLGVVVFLGGLVRVLECEGCGVRAVGDFFEFFSPFGAYFCLLYTSRCV